jgi:hypothetical protein
MMLQIELKLPKFLNQVRHTIRLKRYSCLTEKNCVAWIGRYTLFHLRLEAKRTRSDRNNQTIMNLMPQLRLFKKGIHAWE